MAWKTGVSGHSTKVKLLKFHKLIIPVMSGLFFACFIIACTESRLDQPISTTLSIAEENPNIDSKIVAVEVNVALLDEAELSTEIIPETPIDNSRIILDISPSTVARYKIKEELTRFVDPIIAIGETSAIEGKIQLDYEGKIISPSLIYIDAKTLKSDENKRDNWIVRTGILGDVIELNLTDIDSLPWPLPESGEATFTIIGELNISDITRPTVWSVDGFFSKDVISGVATTVITWEEFQISKPRLPFIISVDDDIKLEIDFNVTR